MDERKKADVIALFSQMKANAPARKRFLVERRKSGGDTTIIDSTVLICPGEHVHGLLAKLLAAKKVIK